MTTSECALPQAIRRARMLPLPPSPPAAAAAMMGSSEQWVATGARSG
jgi:hypothetical protein